MNSTGRTIAKNFGVMLVSQFITWGLTLLLTVFLPRYLGAAAVGKLHLANSIWAIIAVFATFGMDLLLTKEVARRPERTSELLGTSILLRIILYGLGFLGVSIYARMAGYPDETVLVIYIIGVANVFLPISGGFDACIKGLERMEFISIATIITKALITSVSIALLLMGAGVIPIATVGIGATTLNLLILFYYLRRLQPLIFRFDRQLVSWMLRASFSYLMVYIFLVTYQQVDIVIISLLVSEKGVGWYGSADQLFGTLLFIPTVFITAVYPALSRAFDNTSESLKTIMQKSFYLLLLISVPLGLGIFVVADQLVVLLFGGEFTNSAPVLAIMGIVLILTSQNMLLGQYMISVDRQKVMIWVMAGATLLTLPLDFLLVPWCQQVFGNGVIGGALSYLITETAMIVVILMLMPKGLLEWKNTKIALRSLIAGGIMVAATWWCRDLFIVIPILIGAAVYIGMVILLRAMPQEDMLFLKRMIHESFVRLRGKSTQAIN